MPEPKLNRARERRIELEIVIDAYTPEESAMGWYYYLEAVVSGLIQASGAGTIRIGASC